MSMDYEENPGRYDVHNNKEDVNYVERKAHPLGSETTEVSDDFDIKTALARIK